MNKENDSSVDYAVIIAKWSWALVELSSVLAPVKPGLHRKVASKLLRWADSVQSGAVL